jgi:hypothetical protein
VVQNIWSKTVGSNYTCSIQSSQVSGTYTPEYSLYITKPETHINLSTKIKVKRLLLLSQSNTLLAGYQATAKIPGGTRGASPSC